MKIRCKNCYRVLNENEDYCTSCGEYSPEMAEYMRTGVRKISNGEKLRTALIFFAFVAFIGTGVFSIGASLVQGQVRENATYEVISKLVTSMGLIVSLAIIYRKELKGIFFRGTLLQILGSLFIGVLATGSIVLVSTLTNVTKVVPTNLLEFVGSGSKIFDFITLLFVLSLVSICEEFIFRHRLVTFFDEDTMLSDVWTVILTVLISTILSFAWFMKVELLIMTVVINTLMTLLYINTNRSLGINIIVRIILYTGVLLINYIV